MTHSAFIKNIVADNNDDFIEETVLLIIELKHGTVVFDRLQRSNFSILGLRTARLSKKTANHIFVSNIKGTVIKICRHLALRSLLIITDDRCQ